MIINFLQEIYAENEIFRDVPLKNHTTMRTGGPADIMVFPDTQEKILETVLACKRDRIPFTVVGRGSNLIVRDGGIRGVVINLTKKFTGFEIKNNVIHALAGCTLRELSMAALQNCLSGFEFAAGIPGTLGGGVVMNAGAYGGEIKDVVRKVRVLDRDDKIIDLNNPECEFGYRKSILQTNEAIVLGCEIVLKKGSDRDEIKNTMESMDSRRKLTQPLEYPSAGSVFKRPEGYYTGPLIESCNLKGRTIGGAMVSEKHCGFIINTGDARASDVIDLIELVKREVYNKHKVELQTEVKIIGEEL